MKVIEHEALAQNKKLEHIRKLYLEDREKNQSFDSTIWDFKISLFEGKMREAAFLAKLNSLQADHDASKSYLGQKTQEVADYADKVPLQTKNFSKAMNLSGFSNQVGVN